MNFMVLPPAKLYGGRKEAGELHKQQHPGHGFSPVIMGAKGGILGTK